MIIDVPYVVAQAPACSTMTMEQALKDMGTPIKFFEGRDAKRFVKAFFAMRGVDDGVDRPEDAVSIYVNTNTGVVVFIGWVDQCAIGAARMSIDELERVIAIIAGRGV
jgi:hypothetical protein